MTRLLDLLDDDSRPAPGPAAWLERMIASPNLHEVVAELAVARMLRPHGSGTGAESSDDPYETPADRAADWLGDAADDVLERGLAALPETRLAELLQSPHLLVDLQDLVLAEGGDHWLGLLAIHAPTPPPAGLLERLQAIDRPQPL
jgi:hypothetical protein